MGRGLLVLLLWSLAGGCAAAETEVTVVTFNIRAAGLDGGELAWEQRRDLDDLGLACVECNTEFGNRNTILYDESQLVLRDSGVFWLSETPQVPFSVSWGNEEWPRWVTWAHFEYRGASSGSRRFAAYNTHLDHRAPESRMPSLELILKHAAEHAAELPLVLLGDFNARPDRPEVRFLTEGNGDYPHLPLSDVLAQPGQTANEATYRSFVDSSQVARLDYIFASEEFGYREARVLRGESRGATPPSDHSPVRAVLTLNDEP